MNSKKKLTEGFSRPFQDLQHLVETKSLRLKPVPPCSIHPDGILRADCEQKLFQIAMSDVKPVCWKRPICCPEKHYMPLSSVKDTDSEALSELIDLVDYGRGFIVSDTPEYIEGRGYGVGPEVPRRLHRGDFSIQDHIDLHGLNAREAEIILTQFIRESVESGKRAVLIIHGRGLSSPVQPVLKNRICRWLTSGPWRKWVMAFTSARPCDGGTGATYVLLREKPLTKSHRKKTSLQRGFFDKTD
jgi:DNA-nicking Smr family endonuclease